VARLADERRGRRSTRSAGSRERTASAVEGEASVEIDRTSQDTEAAQAIRDALRNFPADEIVVLTRPGEDTTWLEDEAVPAALDAHGIPVRHVELAQH
jgi:hypothetical protein